MNRFLTAAAAGYGAIGVVALARPDRVPALFGGTAPTAAARTEVRAVYGGLPLAVAGLLVTSPHRSAVPMGVLSAGMAGGRVAGALLEGEPAPAITRAFVGIELGLAVACFLGARRARVLP